MKEQKRGLISLVILSLLFCALSVVFADIGPKDQLTVRLDNPPDEPYYLDLLWQPGEETYSSELSQEELASLDPELLAEFERAVPEGWPGGKTDRKCTHPEDRSRKVAKL